MELPLPSDFTLFSGADLGNAPPPMVSREGKWVKVRQEEEQHWKIRDTTYFDREAVIYRVDPADPASAGFAGEGYVSIERKGRKIEIVTALDVESDLKDFHIIVHRTIFENGVVKGDRDLEGKNPARFSVGNRLITQFETCGGSVGAVLANHLGTDPGSSEHGTYWCKPGTFLSGIYIHYIAASAEVVIVSMNKPDIVCSCPTGQAHVAGLHLRVLRTIVGENPFVANQVFRLPHSLGQFLRRIRDNFAEGRLINIFCSRFQPDPIVRVECACRIS